MTLEAPWFGYVSAKHSRINLNNKSIICVLPYFPAFGLNIERFGVSLRI